MEIRFDDHPSFHRAAAGMVGGSLVFSLALHPVAGWPVSPIAAGLLGIAAGAAWAYGKPTWRMAAAVAACAPLVIGSGTIGAPVVAAMCGLLALGVGLGGVRGTKGLVAIMLALGTTAIAVWAAQKFQFAQQLVGISPLSKHLLAGTAMGMIGTLAVLPRHLRIAFDPVTAALRGLPAHLDGEVKTLCTRSVAIWNTTKAKLDDSDPNKELVRDAVLKTIEVATKSADIKLSGATDAELAARMEDFDKRIAAASDAEIKTQYQQARAALEDQCRYRARIRQDRERLVARMHNHVTTLEKFQLAATGLEVSRVAQQPATKQLDELSADVAASGEALAEIELGVSGPSPTPLPEAPSEAAEAVAKA